MHLQRAPCSQAVAQQVFVQSPTLLYQVSKEATLTRESRATRPDTLKPQFSKKFKLIGNFDHNHSVLLPSTKSLYPYT